MLFLDGKSLALATSHSLSISADQIDISTKDNGNFAASQVGKISWELSTESLYVVDDFNTLFEAMVNKTPLDIVYGIAKDYDPSGLGESEDTWTAPDEDYYSGKAVITSLTQNSNAGEMSTYSATFTGNSAIEYVGASNVTSLNP